MTQYYPNSTGYVMHAYRKDTINYVSCDGECFL